MIDMISFRIRIGKYNASRKFSCSNHISQHGNSSHDNFIALKLLSLFSFMILTFYTFILLIGIQSDCANIGIPTRLPLHVRTADSGSSYSVSHGMVFSLCAFRIILTHIHRITGNLDVMKIYYHLRYRYSSSEPKLYKTFRRSLVWLVVANLILLTCCNMSITNPGPTNSLSIIYQNVQGLLPFSELKNDTPKLHESKLNELQCYGYMHKPDIIVLNETWLKDSIHDNEIFSPDAYKIFRCDRNDMTHPVDPSNPDRFRRNGGECS